MNGGLAAGSKYLDDGKLYVAKFKADGTGEWVELMHGKNGLTADNASYSFADQADVLVHARLAGDVVGATKMDRPEWGAVNPLNSEVYMSLTNNAARTADETDAANPRYYEGGDGETGNPNGHIIRWREGGGSNTSTTFQWDVYLFGAKSDAASDVNLSGLTAVNDFSSPDGLSFDQRGMLWIKTDDSALADVTNCMMLAAVPGQVGDGAKDVSAAGGTKTIVGAQATTSNVRRFLVGPVECEITGSVITPDAKTMLVNVQHPGEDSMGAFSSHWPDSQTNASSTKRPRSATVVITRKDGGTIGI